MPFTSLKQRLAHLATANPQALLQGRLLGLEREALRVAADGHIAQTPHPRVLGATLTHPLITTDYSEALLEFITPPLPDAASALSCLEEIQRFVYPQLGDELLWAASMPCILDGEASIPIAVYGTSNLGKMKHIYRRGLAWRYGRIMQVIAGIHFNFSLPQQFWEFWHEAQGGNETLQQVRSAAYFGLIRNLQRYGWLMLYLFGASPAICKSFLAGKTSADLELLNEHSCYGRYATSLRMSNVGYNNRSEKKSGVNVCYNSLAEYIHSLRHATSTAWPPYQRLGIKVDEEYRQLNANILQIENEYYTSMRPKQPPQGNEKPSSALRERGVGYVELRSLDINPLLPLGMSVSQLRFVEAFLLLCLLADSPPLDSEERRMIDDNQMATALRGRDPDLVLQRRHAPAIGLRAWADALLEELSPLCAILDSAGADHYAASLAQQRELVADPERTPSAQILADLHRSGETFFNYAKRLAQQHRQQFLSMPLPPAREEFFSALAQQSLDKQRELEAADRVSFEDFLQSYFAQD